MTETFPIARAAHNQAMAATLRLLRTTAFWTKPGRIPLCEHQGLIRGYAHAYQVMDRHAGHNCPRYAAAVACTRQERP